jgi:hypothetical protein
MPCSRTTRSATTARATAPSRRPRRPTNRVSGQTR